MRFITILDSPSGKLYRRLGLYSILVVSNFYRIKVRKKFRGAICKVLQMHLKKVMKILQFFLIAALLSAGVMMARAVKILITLLLNEGKI